MELFTQLFGDMLAFVYHCFDRIVIYGYLSGLSRPEQVVHFFRNVVGVATVDKEVLSRPGRAAHLVQNRAGDHGYAQGTPRLATLTEWRAKSRAG
jgi:hypothetical protein